MGKLRKKVISYFILATMAVQVLYSAAVPVRAEAEAVTLFTDYLPVVNEVTDSQGFIHPGVSLTKDLLENMREQVREQAEPWNTYFNAMLQSYAASANFASSNISSTDSTKPALVYFNSQGVESRFSSDALRTYTQALLYFITGNEVYRSNAMRIIRLWSQMDPAQYSYYTDATIHAGIPLQLMVTGAEILKYTSCETESLVWTDKDTKDFTTNLITPVTETFLYRKDNFMNQHNYPLIGAIAGYIFTGDRERYNEGVEWFTVNATANDQGFNGSIKQLFRLVTESQETGMIVGEGTPVEPYVQHMEMGRDQAHGGGDLINAEKLCRLLLAQGTKVDPVTGTVSEAADAVGPYEFLNDRILAAADYYWKFMLGYDTEWTPQAYAITGGDASNGGMGGTIRDTYNYISPSYKGRYGNNACWGIYAYYSYYGEKDLLNQVPYLYEAITKKRAVSANAWNSADGEGDFWLFLPPEAESDKELWLSQDTSTSTIYEMEARYAKYDSNVSTKIEEDTAFIRINATEAGTKLTYLSSYIYSATTFAFKIRTNGVTKVDMMQSSYVLPDTKGEWKYVAFTGAPGDFMEIAVYGSEGVTVDIDHLNLAAATELSVPVFHDNTSDLKVYTYVGASLSVDLSASDSDSTDTLTYELQTDIANGPSLNTDTGMLTWQPEQGGSYKLTVTVSDGTALAAKEISIIVGSSRMEAIQTISILRDPNVVYVEATRLTYESEYDRAIALIDSATDAEFDRQLQVFRKAAEGLTPVTPLAKDGATMRWSSVITWSTFGTAAVNIDDNDYTTGCLHNLAQGTLPNIYHYIDFGPDYKVSAYKFGFQSNIFADRLANSTVYGSNDKENWTRLTPGVTAFTQSYQTLEVAPAYQNMKFRYIKLEMIQPLPDVLYGMVRNMLQPQEFQIYGTRYEVGNKIETVSIGADNAVLGKASTGDTIQLNLKAKEAIQNVKVIIQGREAAVTSADNINWTARLATNEDTLTGDVKFTIDYSKADGTAGDTIYMTTDNSKLLMVEGTKYIDTLRFASVTASHIQWPGNGLSKEQVAKLLFDGNPVTYGDLNNEYGYYTIDFGEGAAVKLSQILLMPRAAVPARMLGITVQGSNDNNSWTDITKGVSTSVANEWTNINSSSITDKKPYRYIRLYNSSSWSGNLSEVEFYGELDTSAAKLASQITSVDTPSSDTSKIAMPKVPDGYTIAVKATVPEGLIETDGTFIKAAYDTKVSVVFNITKTADKTTADTNSIITLVPGLNKAPKINVSKVAVVTASDRQWGTSGTPLTKEQIGYYLFDGDLTTAGDLNTGSGAYYTVDFGAGASVLLNEIKLMPRTGNVARAAGTVILGSNDNINWTTLTSPVVSPQTNTWISYKIDTILDQNRFRYLKIYNSNTWFGNLAEVEFYGEFSYNVDERIVGANAFTKGSYYLYLSEVNRIKAALLEEGADEADLLKALEAAKSLLVSKSVLTANQITVSQAMVNASTVQWPNTGTTQQNGWRAFDGDIGTATDATSNPSWIIVDFGEGNEQVISSVKYYPKSNSTGIIQRMNGAVLQGSEDGKNFTNLYTINNVTAAQWYSAVITDDTPYRYFRYYTTTGFANVAELELYMPAIDKTLLTLLLEKASEINTDLYTGKSAEILHTAVAEAQAVNGVEVITQAEVDSASESLEEALNQLRLCVTAAFEPSVPNGLAGWYTIPVSLTLSTSQNTEYSLDQGESWSPYEQPVIFSEDGVYSVLYRYADEAESVEVVTGAAIKIDSTAPVTSAVTEGTGYNNLYLSDVVINLSAQDNGSGIYDTNYKIGDEGEWKVYEGPIVLADNGVYKISICSTDIAGNRETEQSLQIEIDKATMSKEVPGKGVLSEDNGYDGIQNGDYTVSMNLWYGDNGRIYKLYENGILIDTQLLTENSPNPQKAVTHIAERKNGTYVYQAELINANGTSTTNTITVEVTQAVPGKPDISNDNWDNDGNYSIYTNLWWGKNGIVYKLYENGNLIDTQLLTDNTPSQQSAVTLISNRAVGTYEYYAEFSNAAGTVRSNSMTVTVSQ